jgi:hypothetical protein
MLNKVLFFLFLVLVFDNRSISCIKADELYQPLVVNSHSDCAKDPGLSDCKSVHISNIDRLAIAQPQELSRSQNGDFQLEAGINISSEVSKKYNLSICATFKNEAEYLEEWIEYHRNFGVDHFYLYNIESKDYFQSILSRYIQEGIVTLVNWPEIISPQNDNHRWTLITQVPAYENAVNFLARDETKWLVFVDINEFLVSPEGNIMDLLEKYDDFPGISLSADFFDDSIQTTHSLKNAHSLMLNPPSDQTENELVSKMIFKPNLCKGFDWPPYRCRFYQSSIKADPQELRIKRYIKDSSFVKKSTQMHDLDCCILYNEAAELTEKEYLFKDHFFRPMYQHVPEFLKKLKKEAAPKEVCKNIE